MLKSAARSRRLTVAPVRCVDLLPRFCGRRPATVCSFVRCGCLQGRQYMAASCLSTSHATGPVRWDAGSYRLATARRLMEGTPDARSWNARLRAADLREAERLRHPRRL